MRGTAVCWLLDDAANADNNSEVGVCLSAISFDNCLLAYCVGIYSCKQRAY